MPLLGSHLSVAGGYHNAVLSAAEFGMDCVQIFAKNANRWQGKVLTEDEVSLFRETLSTTGISHPSSHASYLINLGSPKDDLQAKSIAALVDELQRAHRLGVEAVIFHPGSHVQTGEETGLARVVAGLDKVLEQTTDCDPILCIENTAGQGTNLGAEFWHLQYLLENVQASHRLGVCLDTCHLFAAGHALSTPEEYEATMQSFEETVGADWVRSFHLNDSVQPFGSRKDRHEHIGEGEMGLEPFRHVLNDPRWSNLPMYLETAKEVREEDGRHWDEVNLAVLRSLMS